MRSGVTFNHFTRNRNQHFHSPLCSSPNFTLLNPKISAFTSQSQNQANIFNFTNLRSFRSRSQFSNSNFSYHRISSPPSYYTSLKSRLLHTSAAQFTESHIKTTTTQTSAETSEIAETNKQDEEVLTEEEEEFQIGLDFIHSFKNFNDLAEITSSKSLFELMGNPVKTSALEISQRSKYVRIDFESVEKLAIRLHEERLKGNFSLKTWKSHPLNPKVANEDALNWIFLVDTLNFSFWHREIDGVPQIYEVEFEGNKYTGYWALCAVIQRALQDGIPITNAEFMSTVDLPTLKHIFRSTNGVECPMIEKRLWAMNEAGSNLSDFFDGQFVNVVKMANSSANELVRLVIQNFSSYRDEAVYEDIKAYFWKRAQILVADVWACFEGEGYGKFNDISFLSMFADYRVPQALAYFGLIRYSDFLMETLKTNPFLPACSTMEMEIRATSITAIEVLAIKMKELELEWINDNLPVHLRETEEELSVTLDKYINESEKNAITKDDLKVGNEDNDNGGDNDDDVSSKEAEEVVTTTSLSERDIEIDKLRAKLDPLNSVVIDFYLWDFAKKESEAMKHIPIHKTTTYFY